MRYLALFLSVLLRDELASGGNAPGSQLGTVVPLLRVGDVLASPSALHCMKKSKSNREGGLGVGGLEPWADGVGSLGTGLSRGAVQCLGKYPRM